VQIQPSRAAEDATNGRHAPVDILAGGLGGFDIDVHRPIAPLPVQMAHQGQETTGLAGLAGGVEQEILLPLDEREHVVQIPAVQGRQAVMDVGSNRAFGVEKAHGGTPGDAKGVGQAANTVYGGVHQGRRAGCG